tara:strand:- start:2924 stop:3076 length:153 start_codon:yes stop_codon:yes gene_type:complete
MKNQDLLNKSVTVFGPIDPKKQKIGIFPISLAIDDGLNRVDDKGQRWRLK